ncbi:inositol monophosphatase family protein [Sphingobium mellinum]|uniref:inositol monophosphatase family protein n=1 Tax=Sphingobium mellinum TaxID=1387166 RepID=UPI0030EDD51E
MTRLGSELQLALDAAQVIAQTQMERFDKDFRVLRKEAREFVTSVDLECHALAHERLGICAPVLSEETRGDFDFGHDLCWIVDPLDGSHNYIAGLPNFGVSIALVESGRFVLGVIGIPFFGEVYHAVEGQGAFRNDIPVRVSPNAVLSKAMIAYDNQFHLSAGGFDRYRRLTEAAFTTRILGSAAYDLALVSRGRIDARVLNATKVFDVAAGIVLVREAGGQVTDFAGCDVHVGSKEILASNGQTHGALLSVLEEKMDEEADLVHGGIGIARDPGQHPRFEPIPAGLGAGGLCR